MVRFALDWFVRFVDIVWSLWIKRRGLVHVDTYAWIGHQELLSMDWLSLGLVFQVSLLGCFATLSFAVTLLGARLDKLHAKYAPYTAEQSFRVLNFSKSTTAHCTISMCRNGVRHAFCYYVGGDC